MAEITAATCRYFGKTRRHIVQIGYAFNMAKRNNKVEGLQRFYRMRRSTA